MAATKIIGGHCVDRYESKTDKRKIGEYRMYKQRVVYESSTMALGLPEGVEGGEENSTFFWIREWTCSLMRLPLCHTRMHVSIAAYIGSRERRNGCLEMIDIWSCLIALSYTLAADRAGYVIYFTDPANQNPPISLKLFRTPQCLK